MALRFKNDAIKKHKSVFKLNKSGRYDPVFTPFGFDRNTKYKGLCLREYHNGEKHFVVRFRLKGDRKRPRVFPVGKFDTTLSIKTNEVLFGTKECEERLFPIVKDHCDELGRWLKDPNETLKFNKVTKNLTTGETIELFCKDGFPKMREEGKLSGKQIREKASNQYHGRPKYGGMVYGYSAPQWDLPYDLDRRPRPDSSFHITGKPYYEIGTQEEEKEEITYTWDKPQVKDPEVDYKPGRFKHLDEAIRNTRKK